MTSHHESYNVGCKSSNRTFIHPEAPMASFKHLVHRLVREESAQGITEYGLILGLVVLSMWVAISASNLGAEITALLNRVKDVLGFCSGGGGVTGVGGGWGGGCGSGGGGGAGGGGGGGSGT